VCHPATRTITSILEREREMADDQVGWIFPNSASRSGHIESMKAPFRRVVLRSGLDPIKVTPHTMRHTAITELAETGAEGRTIQAFSGHKSREMVWRYTHARDLRVNEALDRLEQTGNKVERLGEHKRSRS
jgi:integrase